MQEEIKQEAEKTPEEKAGLLKVLMKSMEMTLSSDDAEVQAESSGAATGRSTCSAANFLPYRESPACPDQDQVVCQNDKARIAQSIDQQHRETSRSLAEAVSVIGSASVSLDPDRPVTCKSKGAIPKKARSRSTKPFAKVPNATEAKDLDGLMTLLSQKCIAEHDDYFRRIDDVEEYCKLQSRETEEKALKAVSRGFWAGSILADIWEFVSGRSGQTFTNVEGEGFFQKVMQFHEADVFREGMSPWFDEARKIPFFERCKDERGRICFILGKDRLPSKAIQACREQPIVAGFYCFFQILVYESVLELVGEKVFDWHYSRHDTRLQLMAEEEMQYIHKLTLPPIIPATTSGNKNKNKIGKIRKWENLKSIDKGYIDRLDISYGICVDACKGDYLVPGTGNIRRVATRDKLLLQKSGEKGGMGTLMPKEEGASILETEYRLDWAGIIKMKATYKDYIQKLEYNQSRGIPEERQHRLRRKVKSSFSSAPEQSPINFPEQSLSTYSQGSALVAPLLCQDETTDFEASINKTKSDLVHAVRVCKFQCTAESRERLASAIAELEKYAGKLKDTSEIDDDKRRTLERQINATLKSARKTRDST